MKKTHSINRIDKDDDFEERLCQYFAHNERYLHDNGFTESVLSKLSGPQNVGHSTSTFFAATLGCIFFISLIYFLPLADWLFDFISIINIFSIGDMLLATSICISSSIVLGLWLSEYEHD